MNLVSLKHAVWIRQQGRSAVPVAAFAGEFRRSLVGEDVDVDLCLDVTEWTVHSIHVDVPNLGLTPMDLEEHLVLWVAYDNIAGMQEVTDATQS